MKTYRDFFRIFLPLLLLLTITAGHVNAALQAVGPVDPVTTIPTFYQDTSNLALQPCLDQNGFCLLPGGLNKDGTPVVPNFDPAFPNLVTITTTPPITDANFPGEGFYYSAQAIMPIEAGELANLAFVLEFAFLTGVNPNAAITFLRTDLQKMRNLALNATYRVTHPYGTFEFTTDGAGNTTGGGGVAVRQEDPFGSVLDYMPAGMKSAQFTNMGPFLTPADGVLLVDPVSGHTYIGNPAAPPPPPPATAGVLVTGSPTGNNFFRIERLSGTPPAGSTGNSWQINTFVLMGRVFTGQIPSPLTIDRATYARDAASEQIDVFATAVPSAVLTVSGTDLAETPLTQDTPNTGKFFAHIPGSILPTGVTMTNSLDNPAIPYPVSLVDEVKISQATYNPVTRDLTIKAASSDKLVPPTLAVPQFAAPNTLNALTGTLVKTIAANTIPPMTVTVASTHLGAATATVSVVVPPAAPVAVADTATTAADTPVVIAVLANDTTAGTLDPAAIVTASPANGTAVANPANGTVTFTPAAGFSGTGSFTYTVKDILGQVSNSVAVTITVTSPVVPPATGVALFSSVPTPQLAGTAVSFNAAATGGSGNYEYQYWLRNTSGLFSLVQPFAASSTWNWNTTGLVAGSYSIAVQARSVGSTSPNGFDAEHVSDFFIIAGAGSTTPATAVGITTDPGSPQVAGTPVVVTGTASGGSGFYEYQFWLKDTTGTYTLVRPFSTIPNWTWNTTGLQTGAYTIAVQARSIGTSPNGFNVENTAPFNIQ